MSPAARKFPVTKAAERRLAAGASLQKVANELAAAGFKVSASTIWRWEVEKAYPSGPLLQAWGDVLAKLEKELRQKLQALADERK